MALIDRPVGIYHFIFDQTPRNIPEVAPRPSRRNPWLKDGKPLVAKIQDTGNIKQSVERVLALLGPLSAVISNGDNVMIKPNFNSDDPPPASTDLPFLKTVVQILVELGARVTIGESAGGIWRPTVNVFKRLGLYDFARSLGVKLVAFEEAGNEWVRIPINGDYLHSVTVPRTAYEADRRVYLPCLKTHRLAGYSGALKLAFGFVSPGERRAFHLSGRQEKLAEISLCWQPDLIIMDGRKAFVTGGPQKGEIVEPRVIIASGDLVGIDVEAVRILMSYRAKNRLTGDPWHLPQIATAVKHGLGAPEGGYITMT